jgi:DNA-binding NtrC family response regulator
MATKEESMLQGKKILIADDEPDILSSLEDLLSSSELVKASTFEEAKKQLETQKFDFAILDIMGINGYELLEIAVEKGITAVMLTAHSLSPEDTVKSFQGGAASYVPKDEIGKIAVFLADIIESKKKGNSPRAKWLDRLEGFYNAKFGRDWMKTDDKFWKNFPY